MSLKDFKVLQKLGAGAYSVVHKVKRKDDGKVYALKKVKFIKFIQENFGDFGKF